MDEPKKYKDSTIINRAGVEKDNNHGSVIPPIYMSTNYTFAGYGDKRPYDYSRTGNPTRDDLGGALAALEGGYGAVVTSTGMSALNVMFYLLDTDDVIIAPHDCYGGTYRLLEARDRKKHFRVNFVDQTDHAALEEAFAEKPKMILVETPSNPLLRITDFKKIVELSKQHGTIIAADNTFLSPVFQRPLELGADIVMHSTTKYLNGHGDVVGGAVIAKTKELHEELAWWANCTGVTGAAFDSYLTLRGLRTLEVRMEKQSESAAKIVEFLDGHDAVKIVNYPGLASHKGHDVAKQQQTGFGAMLSFELEGDEDTVRMFLANLELFALAESLGGFESLVAHPASMTHAGMDPEARRRAGLGDTLLRLSIGLESPDDLIADLAQAFDRLSSKSGAFVAAE